MTPEALDSFRKRFHKLYLDNPDAEALAQAGCTLIGEIERLTGDLGEALHVIETVRRVRTEALSAVADARRQRDEARVLVRRWHEASRPADYYPKFQDALPPDQDVVEVAAKSAIARWDVEKEGRE